MPGNQHHSLSRPDPRSGAAGRLLAEQMLSRAAGAPLVDGNRIRPVARPERVRGRLRGSASRAASGAVLIGNMVRAAMTSQRMLGPVESGMPTIAGIAMLAMALVGMLWPLVVVIPLAAICVWIALTMLVRVVLSRQKRDANSTHSTQSDDRLLGPGDGQDQDQLQDKQRDQR